jgi:hypothetical protein
MRQVSRASVDYILWVRGFRDHTISGPGYNLFKLLRRHFRAGAGPDAGAGAPRRDSFRVSEFSMLCEAENFPSFIGGEFANRRRSSSSPLCFARKTVVGRDLRERSAMAVSWRDEAHTNNIPRFCFSERKSSEISKAAISPRRDITEMGWNIWYCVASTLSFLHNTGNSLLFALLVRYFDNHDRRRQTASPNTRGSSIPRDRPSKMEVRLLFGMRYQLPARLERQPRTLASASIGLRPNFTTALTLSGWPERRYRPGAPARPGPRRRESPPDCATAAGRYAGG